MHSGCMRVRNCAIASSGAPDIAAVTALCHVLNVSCAAADAAAPPKAEVESGRALSSRPASRIGVRRRARAAPMGVSPGFVNPARSRDATAGNNGARDASKPVRETSI